MKTLATFAAAAALIAGIGIANAQNSQAPAAANPAAAGSGKFCLTTKSGPKNCSFASLQECQTKAKGMKGTCAANTDSSTTGQK
ncbi:MAG TPA: DUF3551 domain-containing protein [Pseudolabrys sp.]|jgi:hypothetical protein|nr:DUF3551 domain-containing protein [Pseudolabrys sp.]